MKLLDRYIISKQFLLTALFGIITFTIIFIVIDLMEKLDDFLDKKAAAMIIVRSFIAFTPEMIKLMTPVAVLLSSLFTTGKMSNSNELTAMKSSRGEPLPLHDSDVDPCADHQPRLRLF